MSVGFVKVMNTLPTHPKAVLAGDRAMWLFICGLCYSNEHETDGRIVKHVLPAVSPGMKNPGRQASELVRAGLWQDMGDSWMVHDYLEYQRSAEMIRQLRDKDAQRKARVRNVSARNPNGHIAESARTAP